MKLQFHLSEIHFLLVKMYILEINNLIVDIRNYPPNCLYQEYTFLLVGIVFLVCEIVISTSKKLIIDINNYIWMAAYCDIKLVKIKLQISTIAIVTSKNPIPDIKN